MSWSVSRIAEIHFPINILFAYIGLLCIFLGLVVVDNRLLSTSLSIVKNLFPEVPVVQAPRLEKVVSCVLAKLISTLPKVNGMYGAISIFFPVSESEIPKIVKSIKVLIVSKLEKTFVEALSSNLV